jgi:ribonuclease Y
MSELLIAGLALLVGAAVGWLLGWLKARADGKEAGTLMEGARQQAQSILREAHLQAHDEMYQARQLFDKETQERRQEFSDIEKRLLQREATLDRKTDVLEQRLEDLKRRETRVVDGESALHTLQDEIDVMRRRCTAELERVSGLTAEEARQQLRARVADDARVEADALARGIVDEARQHAEQEARRVITTAIERCASEAVQSATTCLVTLPSEEMKGRIIGREGRNIRAFEAVTGVNVLIDDTPQTVVLSGFDPLRREVAKLTMERLVVDGRINPARIEEEATKVQAELKQSMDKAGEDALYRLGLRRAAPEILQLLGRLRFRHSFSQNVLDHSVEVARVAGLMAAELGLDQETAKRVGLFHDIGKAVDQELPGSHALVGAQLLKKYGEAEAVCAGVASHHHEVQPVTIYGGLIGAADAVSASRPGARSESVEMYLARLEKLEALANSFPGVEKSYALQAGREVRVLVEPGKVGDPEAAQLARDIRKKIEQELQFPGQIKVTVVRETRAVEFAK